MTKTVTNTTKLVFLRVTCKVLHFGDDVWFWLFACLGPSHQMSSSSVSLSSTTTYIHTATASDVYGGNGPQLVCPTKTCDPVTLTIQSKTWNVINEIIRFITV